MNNDSNGNENDKEGKYRSQPRRNKLSLSGVKYKTARVKEKILYIQMLKAIGKRKTAVETFM